MSKAFDEMSTGLREAIEFAKGRTAGAVVHRLRPVNVRELRCRLGMTQERFAAALGVGLGTLRHWERGDRQPRGPALALLNVVDRKPEAVLEALM